MSSRSLPIPPAVPANDSDIFPGISSQQLAEGIGNLFYDALGDFLRALHADEALAHIELAWKICQGKDENHPKHARQVPCVALPLAEIARHIVQLPAPQQGLFFAHLAEKLHQDGVKDEKRGRVRLAQALFAAAASLGKMGCAIAT